MNPWFRSRNPPVPSDRAFERLRKRYVTLEFDDGWLSGAWGSALGLVIVVAVLLIASGIGSLSGSGGTVVFWICYAAAVALISRIVMHRQVRAAEAQRISDLMIRRADRCLCDVCHRTLQIDDDGRAPCDSCGITYDRAGWALTQVPRYEELEPISDEAYPRVVERRAAYARRVRMFGVLYLIAALAVVGVLLIAHAATLGTVALLALMFVLVYITWRFEHRETACNALLCTRPDLWDPSTLHLPLSTFRGLSEYGKERKKIVKNARRVMETARPDAAFA